MGFRVLFRDLGLRVWEFVVVFRDLGLRVWGLGFSSGI